MTIQHSFMIDPKDFMPGNDDYKKHLIRSFKLSGFREIADKFITAIPYEMKEIEGKEIYKTKFKMFTDNAWDEFLIGIMAALEHPELSNTRLFIAKIIEELENQPII